jgi:hypothetical protein
MERPKICIDLKLNLEGRSQPELLLDGLEKHMGTTGEVRFTF